MLEAAVLCLALNIWHEARGEPLKGQFAVANVTMNRAEGKPENVCKEVYKQAQFSWTLDPIKVAYRPKKSTEEWKRAVAIAKITVNGLVRDVTHGATHYHAVYVKPEWARKYVLTTQIGQHLFYRMV